MTKEKASQFQTKIQALKAKKLEMQAALDAKLQKVIVSRRTKILKIIEKTGANEVDDTLLTGALLFLSDEKNKDNPILKSFLEYASPKKKQKTNQ